MFESLKKKFSSLFKKSEEKEEKPSEAPQKRPKSKENQEQKSDTKKEPSSGRTDGRLQTETQESKTETQTPKTETPAQTLKQEEQTFFTKLKKKLTTSILKQEQFDELFIELELSLLENNVALEAVDKIKEYLKKDLVGISIKRSEINSTILSSLKESILSLLIEPPSLIEQINSSLEPYIILFFGINGSGKTTSIAKLSNYLKENNISSCLAAADTFRAASIEQLEKHAQALKIPLIKKTYGSDPAAVAFDAIQYAKKHKIKTVLIDTAGRMYTNSNLLKEMQKIVKVSKPNLKIFVGESITGNDAIEQAKTFNEEIGIDGIILSKADIDEKAGTILSVSYVTQKPIYFLGTGQKYKDLQPFTKETVLKNLGLEN